jgi:hypothetical protein
MLPRRSKPKFKLPSVHSKKIGPPPPFVPEEEKTLEQMLPSKDLAALNKALEQIRSEIFHTESTGEEIINPSGTLSYSLTIDGSVHFDPGQVSNVKMNVETKGGFGNPAAREACVVNITMHTDLEGAEAIKEIFNNYMTAGVHQYTVRLYKGIILFRSIQLYDARITNYFTEIDPAGNVTINITLQPGFWHI